MRPSGTHTVEVIYTLKYRSPISLVVLMKQLFQTAAGSSPVINSLDLRFTSNGGYTAQSVVILMPWGIPPLQLFISEPGIV